MTITQAVSLGEMKVAVVGRGYVGLLLAVEFGRIRSIVGFDINQQRIDALRDDINVTLAPAAEELAAATQLCFSSDPAYVAEQLVKAMLKQRIQVNGARVLVMGLTFKGNCPALSNTRFVDVIAELQSYGIAVDVDDPRVDAAAAEHEYGLGLVDCPQAGAYDGVMIAVAHDAFRESGEGLVAQCVKPEHVVCDLKNVQPAGDECHTPVNRYAPLS